MPDCRAAHQAPRLQGFAAPLQARAEGLPGAPSPNVCEHCGVSLLAELLTSVPRQRVVRWKQEIAGTAHFALLCLR